MAKKKILCPYCDKYFIDISSFVNHLGKRHNDLIPPGQTPWQHAYILQTGKTSGRCIMCKEETTWNDSTHKYNRLCGKQRCHDEYVAMFKARMIGKYGKTTLLNDPEQQRKMLANRSISGEYVWKNVDDGKEHKFSYTGSYEKAFLEFLDLDLFFDPQDIFSPSPHTFFYIFEGKKHFYIPDFYIASLNLEIEIKDGGDNPNMHHKIQDVDKRKERAKDLMMQSNKKNFNYIKIVNKEHDKFLRYLMVAKTRLLEGDESPIFMP